MTDESHPEIDGFLMLVIFLGPLLVFSSKLYEVRRKGLLEYGALADEYVRSFDRKWLRGKAPEGESLIGSADIQSLADFGNSFEVMRKMRPFVFNLSTMISLAGAAAIPMVPLVLTEIPLNEIITRILGLLL
ncbi:MAG: hypothetical protein Kow0099_22610 [Candidatus Abyssubacteria bacterium]